jgi:hypothetical protein
MVTSGSFIPLPQVAGEFDVKGRSWETRLALDIGFHRGYPKLLNDPKVIISPFLGTSLS